MASGMPANQTFLVIIPPGLSGTAIRNSRWSPPCQLRETSRRRGVVPVHVSKCGCGPDVILANPARGRMFDSAPKRRIEPAMRKLAGVQRNLFFVIVSLFAVAGCGGSGSPAHSSAAASPQGVDPSIGTGADAGQPDAGPTADAPDAGPAVDCSANAPFDARCFDPGTPSIAVTQSDAAQCAPFLPIAVPKPVLFTKTFLGPSIGTGNCGAIADGDGHLGVCMYSDPGYPADGTRTEVMAADGTILATLPGGVRLSGPHGFLTEHTPVDYGQLDTLSAWSGGVAGGLPLRGLPTPFSPAPPPPPLGGAPRS